MTEQNTNFGKLTAREFEQVMNEVATPDFHDLAAEDFFAAMAAIDSETQCEILEQPPTVIAAATN